jgi:hypothetical protein
VNISAVRSAPCRTQSQNQSICALLACDPLPGCCASLMGSSLLPAYALFGFVVRSRAAGHVIVATGRRLKTLLRERNTHLKNRTDSITAAMTMKINTTG